MSLPITNQGLMPYRLAPEHTRQLPNPGRPLGYRCQARQSSSLVDRPTGLYNFRPTLTSVMLMPAVTGWSTSVISFHPTFGSCQALLDV